MLSGAGVGAYHRSREAEPMIRDGLGLSWKEVGRGAGQEAPEEFGFGHF